LTVRYVLVGKDLKVVNSIVTIISRADMYTIIKMRYKVRTTGHRLSNLEGDKLRKNGIARHIIGIAADDTLDILQIIDSACVGKMKFHAAM